jgi:hypothetical protein
MTNAGKQPSIYVVYPAALFHGWEVMKEGVDDEGALFATREEALRCAEARAAREGGGIVKLENWFGDIEDAWNVPAQSPARARSTRATNDAGAARFPVLRGLRRSGMGR